jgi:hypothetical protein
MDMKKYLLTLALILPLMAQDSTEVKEEFTQKKSRAKRVWMGLQDAEWRKYNSAHNRAHDKQGGMKRGGIDKRDKRMVMAKRREIQRKRAIRSFVRIVVIGGVAYYIGYTQGQKKHHKHPGKRGDKK